MHTARAFFLHQLRTLAYTIQSTYCLYDENLTDNNTTITKLMEVKDWLSFGSDLAKGIATTTDIIENCTSIKSYKQIANLLNLSTIS